MFNFPPHFKSVCALPGDKKPTKYCFFTQCSTIA